MTDRSRQGPDEAKAHLLGFNEKVTRLESTKFFQRYKDELPSVVTKVDRLDHVKSEAIEGKPGHVRVTLRGCMQFHVEDFDRDEIEAFVLTFRMLTQDNDRYSIRNLAKVYDGDWVPEEARVRLVQARTDIKDYLAQQEALFRYDRTLSTGEVLDVVIYGGLAHSNVKKERTFKAWTSNPTQAALVWAEFIAALRRLMHNLLYIRDLNSALLCNVFNVPPPEHLLYLVEGVLSQAEQQATSGLESGS